MTCRGIILLMVATIVFLPSRPGATGSASADPGGALAEPVAPSESNYGPPGAFLFLPPPADCNTPTPIFMQPYVPMIQPSPPLEFVPLMPLPAGRGPRPAPLLGPIFPGPQPGAASGATGSASTGATGFASAPPGSALAEPLAPVPTNPLAGIAPGGIVSPQFGLPPGPEVVPGLANPILVPVVDDQLAWEQIVDVVSNYFTIAREQQARRSGEVWSEGRIETVYQGGASWLEPHRHDSVGSFNRWESTFQTIRRVAFVRVIPDAGGYLVELVVNKELEDMPRPEHATAGAATFRTDGSLPSGRAGKVSRTLSSPRWIALGRDVALEARILADIHARLAGITTTATPSVFAQ